MPQLSLSCDAYSFPGVLVVLVIFLLSLPSNIRAYNPSNRILVLHKERLEAWMKVYMHVSLTSTIVPRIFGSIDACRDVKTNLFEDIRINGREINGYQDAEESMLDGKMQVSSNRRIIKSRTFEYSFARMQRFMDVRRSKFKIAR